MPLSDLQIRRLKPVEVPRKLTDEGGLYLYLTKAGGKLWRMDCRFEGKRLTLSFGKWPKVSLAAARDMRDAAKQQIAAGRDPRGAASAADNTPAAASDFQSVAERWLERHQDEWQDRHRKRTEVGLKKDVYPTLGARPIGEIEPPEILATIRQIEARGVRETAHRLRGVVSKIFRFAIAEGLATRDAAADITDALARKPKAQHRAKFSRADLPKLVKQLREYPIEPMTRDAIWLTLLTAVRTGETRFAHSSEFEDMDSEEPLWRIPADRMKMGRPHLVPLPRQAVEIVKRRLTTASESGLLFGKDTRSGVLSENGMLYALYRLGYHSRLTVHGFRGSFSTIANEAGWNRDHIEMQLAHVQGAVRGAYNAAEWLPGRRELLQWWADLCAGDGVGAVRSVAI